MEKVERDYMLEFPESLEKVVKQNDFEFLRKTAASEDEDGCLRCLGSPAGNIFHFAAYEDNLEFMEEATKILPAGVIQLLYCQEQEQNSYIKDNPLHIATLWGHLKIVRFILDFYRSQPDILSVEKKPWLGLEERKHTPLHIALKQFYEGAALDILSMDVELLCNMENVEFETPIYIAVDTGANRMAVKLLTCAPNCRLTSSQGRNVLFNAARASVQVCKMLIDKAPQLIIDQDNRDGQTVLHTWIQVGKLYPFECVLNNEKITPDLRKGFINQLCTINKFGKSPLHYILFSVQDDAFSVKIVKILIDAYIQEMGHSEFNRPWFEMGHSEFNQPWLIENTEGHTPLHIAIMSQRELLALYFFSLDSLQFLNRSAEHCGTKVGADEKNNVNLLLFAINNNCPKVAEEILRIILQNEKNTELLQLITLENGESALSYAPHCSATFLMQVLESHPEFITQRKDNGETVLNHWINIGKMWPFKHILKTEDINAQYKSSFTDLFRAYSLGGKRPLHFAAASSMRTEMYDAVKSYLDVCDDKSKFIRLWATEAEDGTIPLRIAISNSSEELAILFLSTDKKLEHVGNDIIFLAISHSCHQVVEYLLTWSIQHGDQKFLKSAELGNLLHVMCKSTEESGGKIAEKWPELINETDKSGKTPLQKASEMGKDWLVKLILQEDHSCMEKTPLAWVEACNYGHVSTVLAFVEHSPYFRSICYEHKVTPLHHIQNADYKGYKQLLEHKFVDEMKNVQNKAGETPLHLAIQNNNKELAEILLTTEDMDWTLKNKKYKMAKDLLNEKCDKYDEWKSMCKLIGVHRMLKAKYLEANTNVMEMRGTISVVATLLATITITAGFAVPGGIDSNGDAILSGSITFWAFIISNAYAMCCAILILFCNTWSMVSDKDRSSRLLDRSLWLLKQSLYGTLMAFTLAMYTVIHKKSFWPAIVVAVMVVLMVILAQRRVLYKILDMLKYFEENPPKLRKKMRSLLSHGNKRETHSSAPNDIENQVGEVEDTATISGVKKSS